MLFCWCDNRAFCHQDQWTNMYFPVSALFAALTHVAMFLYLFHMIENLKKIYLINNLTRLIKHYFFVSIYLLKSQMNYIQY